MFEFIRTHRRLMQFLLLLLIFPSFAFFGLESYTKMSNGDDTVAKVDGQKITQPEWDNAQREQMERFRQVLGPQFDPKMFDTPEAKQEILDNLIAQRVLAAEAKRSKLSVSDQSLQQTIANIDGLKGADGKFDIERYKAALAVQGRTPAAFEAILRQDLIVQQVNAAIQTTAFAPRSLATRLSELSEQERQVQCA
jgi:peptidyl-prolyl cis-trans isomerase D